MRSAFCGHAREAKYSLVRLADRRMALLVQDASNHIWRIRRVVARNHLRSIAMRLYSRVWATSRFMSGIIRDGRL